MKTITAVVGILRNENNEILIAERRADQFMAGFWEFPGGGIEVGETQKQALTRELKEELGITAQQLSPHQTMTHAYDEHTVDLSIYTIDQYQNTPIGVEGQKIAWVKINELTPYNLLPTMKSIIHSLTLPNKYWITPVTNHGSPEWMEKLEQKITQGIKLIQLRSKIALNRIIIDEVRNKCQQNGVQLLLNLPNKDFTIPNCDGYHLTTHEMLALNKRPCTNTQLLGISTHNLAEALQAQAIGADFIVISPIQATQTHPDTIPIGWDVAKEVVDKLNIPVYFLGGMGENDLDKTLKLGAQGIAGVSAF
ncbi:MAG: Thiamine-phosphate synthase [Catillopecten margaritatus gill symbiont]|uniref:8-oxo-dGTP diphosphatase n=1 Tax=Catillopecten margaritatus gill symbiont TaxID=3083288 RepID=A0AAU6PHK8_9GAMM